MLLEIGIGDAYGAGFEFAPVEFVKEFNTLSTYRTHQLGISAGCYTDDTQMSLAIALTSHFFLYDKGSRKELVEYVSEHSKYQWNGAWNRPVACCGEETTNAVLTVLSNEASLGEVLLKSVDFSGDVDTVAAVSLGIANQSGEYEKNLPGFLFDELENDSYGRDYLWLVGKKLLALLEN